MEDFKEIDVKQALKKLREVYQKELLILWVLTEMMI